MCPSYRAILDTSVLHEDYKLEKAHLRELLNIVRLCGNSKVVIPRIVLDEHTEHFEIACQTYLSGLNNTIQKLSELPLVNVSGFSQPKRKGSYFHYLGNILRAKGIDTQPYPKVSHARTLKRLFKKRKPFRENEKGYKDTLIWEGILTLCSRVDNVVFITANWKDFAKSPSGELHVDLIEDLERLGFTADKVVLKTSIYNASEYLRTVCGIDEAGLVANIVQEIRQYVNFDDLLTQNSTSIVECIELNPDSIIEGDDAGSPWLAWNIEDSNVEIESTEAIEDGEFVVHATAVFGNEIEYSISGYTYYNEEETLNRLGLSLYEMDNESDVAEVGGWMTFSLDFSFVYNPESHEISGFEALDIRRVDLRNE